MHYASKLSSGYKKASTLINWITNNNKTDPLRTVITPMRKGMDHFAISKLYLSINIKDVCFIKIIYTFHIFISLYNFVYNMSCFKTLEKETNSGLKGKK